MREFHKHEDGLESVWIDEEDKEWEVMWGKLGAHEHNAGLPDPTVAESDSGECWQYMGTWKVDSGCYDQPLPLGWYHQFRHRDHPILHHRLYIDIPASEDVKPE